MNAAAPDYDAAVAFLRSWAPETSPHALLVSILPDGDPEGRTWEIAHSGEMQRWIATKNANAGIYFTPNACRAHLHRKAKKSDVELLCTIWSDCDPREDAESEPGGWQRERDRLHALAEELMALSWPPSVIIDSGNGIQPLWRLDLVQPAVPEYRDAIEALGRRIEAALGGVENTSNVDRILRVPGTVNFPSKKKRDKGRGQSVARVLAESGRNYAWRELEELAARLESVPLANARPVAVKPKASATGTVDLPPGVPEPASEEAVQALLESRPKIVPIWNQEIDHEWQLTDRSQSSWDLALVNRLQDLPDAEIWSFLAAYRLKHDPKDRKWARRDYVEITISRARTPREPHQIDDEFSAAMEALLKGEGEGGEEDESELTAEVITGDAVFDFTHDGLALGMGRQWKGHAQHVDLWNRWLFWERGLWQVDEKLAHMTRARSYLRKRGDALVRAAQEGKIGDPGDDPEKIIKRCEKIAASLRMAPFINSVVNLTQSNVEIAATVEQWDVDPFLLGTPAGTVDLRSGRLRPAVPTDYITKATAVAPAPCGTTAPRWHALLKRITAGDAELQAYLQRFAGYALTGDIREHAFAFGFGTGANGKSVFLNTVAHILGAYALTIGTEVLMVSSSDRHPTEIARLRGVRLAIGSEVEDGRQWAESKIKSLTGGDRLQARFMRQDIFEFTPQFKLFIVGNHKPSLRNVDEAIQRRLHFVPFTVTIPREERDPQLPEKLKAEWPAILRWMIDGCLEWQQHGLHPPEIVKAATTSYLTAEDALARWADDCGYRDVNAWETSADLWASWRRWAESSGEFVGKQRKFSDRLEQYGLTAERQGKACTRGYRGFRLTAGPDYSEDTRYGS